MKTVGLGGIGALTSLAGCTGNGGGGNGGSNSGSGQNNAGGSNGGNSGGETTSGGQPTTETGGSGGTTSQKEKTEVNITLAPSGFQGIMMDHIYNNTDILQNEMDKKGYTANVQKTWEGSALFASGGPDFSTISTLEAARLGAERNLDLAVFAKVAPLFMGWWAKKGGGYDPNNVGSVQKVMDKLVNEQATTAIGGWGGGDVPGYTMVIKEGYDYTFQQNNNDFHTVTVDYFAVPKLMLDGKVKAGGTSPIHGVARHIDDNGDPRHVELFNCAAKLDDMGLGVPPLNNLTTTKEFIDNNQGAAEAYLKAWHKGMAWLFEDPMGRIMKDKKKHFDQLGVSTKAQAQYLVDWGVDMTLDNQYPYNYKDQELTDGWISKNKKFLTTANGHGFVPDSWQSHLNYVKLPQS